MSLTNPRMLRYAACLLAISAGPAFSATTESRPAPHEAAASVPTLHYESPLIGYRPLSDDKLRSWQEANDNVGRIGGWRAYAKEAAPPEASSPTGGPKVSPATKQDGNADQKLGH